MQVKSKKRWAIDGVLSFGFWLIEDDLMVEREPKHGHSEAVK